MRRRSCLRDWGSLIKVDVCPPFFFLPVFFTRFDKNFSKLCLTNKLGVMAVRAGIIAVFSEVRTSDNATRSQ